MVAGLGCGMTLLDHALAPVVAFERAIHRKAEAAHTGEGGKAVFILAVECRQAIGGVTGADGIEVQDIAVVSFNAEVLVLQVGTGCGS